MNNAPSSDRSLWSLVRPLAKVVIAWTQHNETAAEQILMLFFASIGCVTTQSCFWCLERRPNARIGEKKGKTVHSDVEYSRLLGTFAQIKKEKIASGWSKKISGRIIHSFPKGREKRTPLIETGKKKILEGKQPEKAGSHLQDYWIGNSFSR